MENALTIHIRHQLIKCCKRVLFLSEQTAFNAQKRLFKQIVFVLKLYDFITVTYSRGVIHIVLHNCEDLVHLKIQGRRGV